MESIDLELGELFDRNAIEEDDGDDIGANPDDNNAAPEGDEGDEVLLNLQKLAKGAAKKKVLRPQPKLDAVRLKSDRGLPCLPKLFKDVKFAGKGHEAEDLKLLMSKLEHWAHRLFPKLSFDDFIERLEKLGAKKEIQTCVKRIRLDMPITDSDFATADGPDDDQDNVMDAEAAYDAMIRDELANQQQRDDESNQTSERRSPADDASQTPSSQSLTNGRPSLSTEQQQRIEQNRLLALQKRAARLGLQASSDSLVLSQSSTQPCSAEQQTACSSSQPAEIVSEATVNDSSSVEPPQNSTAESETRSAKTSSADVMQTADEILDDLESDDK